MVDMSERELHKLMFLDAINWQASLVDANRGTEYYDEAKALLKKYRALFKKKFGEKAQNPIDKLFESGDVKLVTLDELRGMNV